MANEAAAFILVLVWFVTGFALATNLPGWLGLSIGLGFTEITNVVSGFFTVIARLAGVAIMAVSGYVMYNIVRG